MRGCWRACSTLGLKGSKLAAYLGTEKTARAPGWAAVLASIEAAPHVRGDLAHSLLERREPVRLALLLLLPRVDDDQRPAGAGADHARRHEPRPAPRVAQRVLVEVRPLVHGRVGDRRQPPLEPLAEPLRRFDRDECPA